MVLHAPLTIEGYPTATIFSMNKSSPDIPVPVLALCSHLHYCRYLWIHVKPGTLLVSFSHQPQTAITPIMQSTGHIATLHTVQTIQIVQTSTNAQYMMTITWPYWHASLGIQAIIFGLVHPGHPMAPTYCHSIQLLWKLSSTTPTTEAAVLPRTAPYTSTVLICLHQPLLTKTYYSLHNVSMSYKTFQIVWVLDSCEQ